MRAAPVFEPGKSKYLVITTDFLLPILISLGVIVLLYIVFFSTLFSINTITCQLDYSPCITPALLAELDKQKGSNIFTYNPQNIIAKLTSGDYTIRDVGVSRLLPGTLSFDLHSVYPVSAIQIAGDQKWIVLDAKNRVIGERSSDPNVPTVTIETPLTLTVGHQLENENILATLSLAQSLVVSQISVKSIKIENEDTINVTLVSGMTVYLTLKKDLDPQIKALQAVLRDATIKKGVRIIDVRFSQPVLR